MSKSRFARGRGAKSGAMGREDAITVTGDNVHPTILKQARRSGVLNLSQRSLTIVPDNVWTLQEDVPAEAKSISLDNTDDKWWETADLTKLILASNQLTTIGEGIRNFDSLTVLDVHDNLLTDLPKAIGCLENLQRLDVSRNKLIDIPSRLGLLAELTTLNMEHNQLTSVCEDLCSLKKLELLNISNNLIESLPRYICLMSHLRSLNISHNKIKSLPPDIGSLNALRLLDATHNSLVSVPDELGTLSNLEQLHVRHNQLQYLPVLRHCKNLKEILAGNNNIRGITREHLEPLTSLSCLDLRDNKLAKVPEDITLLDKLERIDLTNNDISNLPYSMGTMVALKSIVLDGNPMRSIRRDIIMRGTVGLKKFLASRLSEDEREHQPDSASSTNVSMPGSEDSVRSHDLHQMKILDYSEKKVTAISDDVVEAALEAGIKSINLSKNLFNDLPRNINVLAPKLTEMNLGFNKLTFLSPNIAQFAHLHMLDVRNNQLTDLPSELSAVTGLRELTLSNNKLKVIPQVVYSLEKLEILFTAANQITSLDVTGLSNLKALGTLDLQNNDLAQIPPELGNCVWLKSLVLSGNPLRNPRAAIVAKGTSAILEYLRSRIVL